MVRSAGTVGGLTLVSRVLGFVRDVMIAAALGAGPMADAFFVAFKLPNLFRRLFAEGAFNAAFVPLFARRIEEEGVAAARRFAEQALSVLLLVVLGVTVAAEFAMPAIMRVLAPGFAAEPDKFALAVLYGRITFPYLILLSLTALYAGVLNAFYRYAAAAAAPIALNVAFIAALALVIPHTGQAGTVLAWAVFVGGVAQLLWLAAACRRAGLGLRLPRPRLTPGVRRLLILLLPAAGSAGVVHINLLVGNVIASLQAGAVSYLYYADRLYQLPLGVVGIAIGVVLLPELTRALRGGTAGSALAVHNRAIVFAMLLTLPATAGLLAIGHPLVAVLFGRGAFGPDAVDATAAALAAFACGLPAFVLIKLLAPGFFARENTATPLKCAAVAVAINIAFALGLFVPFGHVGIALASALAAWVQTGLLAWLLMRRGHLRLDGVSKRRLARLFAAACGMVLALRLGLWGLAGPLAGATGARMAALAVLILGGLVVYGGLALVFRAVDLDELRRAAGRSPAEAAPGEAG